MGSASLLVIAAAIASAEQRDAHALHTLDALVQTKKRETVDAVLRVACCRPWASVAERQRVCSAAAPRVSWWKGGFGSQLNTMVQQAVTAVLEGAAISSSRMLIVPFTQDRVRPQLYTNASRCVGSRPPITTCLFRPVQAACVRGGGDDVDDSSSSTTTIATSTREQQQAAAAVLRQSHPWLVAAATADLIFTPNTWLKQRVAAVARAVTDALSGGRADGASVVLAVHIRRGDKLTARGNEAIAISPTSSIARLLTQLIQQHQQRLEPQRRPRRAGILVMSDDPDVPDDLQAMLPGYRVVSLELPSMAEATLTRSGRHLAVPTTVAAANGSGSEPAAECGLPAYAGRPALPRCATGSVAGTKAIVVSVTRELAARGRATGESDLGALLYSALAVMASAPIIVASMASNIGALIAALSLGGHRVLGIADTDARARAPYLHDTEESRRAKEPRLSVQKLAEGYYFCRQDWGIRKFGLCRARGESV